VKRACFELGAVGGRWLQPARHRNTLFIYMYYSAEKKTAIKIYI